MQDIIGELINIENKAREVSLSAEQEKARLPQRIIDAQNKIAAEIKADTDDKEKRIKERVAAQVNESVKRIVLESEEKLAHIEYMFSETRGKLEDDLFNQIIGRR